MPQHYYSAWDLDMYSFDSLPSSIFFYHFSIPSTARGTWTFFKHWTLIEIFIRFWLQYYYGEGDLWKFVNWHLIPIKITILSALLHHGFDISIDIWSSPKKNIISVSGYSTNVVHGTCKLFIWLPTSYCFKNIHLGRQPRGI